MRAHASVADASGPATYLDDRQKRAQLLPFVPKSFHDNVPTVTPIISRQSSLDPVAHTGEELKAVDNVSAISATQAGPLKVAIAHDYLTQRGGAEKVVLALTRIFPDATIYTTLYDPELTYPEFRGLDIKTSTLNRFSIFRHHHRLALPLFPFVANSIKIDADIVITSSSGWAHGFKTTGKKLVYCYSPARWLYQRDAYLGQSPPLLTRLGSQVLTPLLRRWDSRSARSCARYLAISTAVQGRIRDAYDIEAPVIPAPFGWNNVTSLEEVPAVTARFGSTPFYLCVSRLLAYKNVDAVIEAFRQLNDPLVVVGKGPELQRLKRSLPPNVQIVNDLSDAQVRWLYSRTQANISASHEDFGLTPLEAAHYGKPSVVLKWGGFLDTVAPGETGVFFGSPEPGDIARAILRSKEICWDEDAIRAHVQRFSETNFSKAVHAEVEDLVAQGSAREVSS